VLDDEKRERRHGDIFPAIVAQLPAGLDDHHPLLDYVDVAVANATVGLLCWPECDVDVDGDFRRTQSFRSKCNLQDRLHVTRKHGK
jgi:hypothetical protein